jgi:4-amino-4-deoxy-L-arabinose transferase-like glycosyltransferase
MREGWMSFIFPSVILCNLLIEIIMLNGYPAWRTMLLPVYSIGVISALALFALRITRGQFPKISTKVFAVLGVAALFISPFVWSMMPALYGDAERPFAGPELVLPENIILNEPFDADVKYLESFLLKKTSGEKYALASPSINLAALLNIDNNMAAITIGGYTGMSNNLNVKKVQELVEKAEIRYFIVDTRNNPRYSEEMKDVIKWIINNGKNVPIKDWYSISPRKIEEYQAKLKAPANKVKINGEFMLRMYDLKKGK